MSGFPVHSGADSTGNNLTGAFNLLTKNRQILLLKTIESGLSSSPPRTQATFDNVLTAYISLTRAVDSSAAGTLSLQHLLDLEADVRNAGGVIAPGLHSDGSKSLSSFRESTFDSISSRYSTDVAKSIFSALNAYLCSLKPSDIGDVFRFIGTFLGPLLLEPGQSSTYDRFISFSDNQKVHVLATIQDSIESCPTRPEGAVFEAVVSAYHSLNCLLINAKHGSISPTLIDELVAAISSAGGKILPSIYASGDVSVAAFKRHTFDYLSETYDQIVCDAILSSLNLRLKGTIFPSLDTFIVSVQTLLAPLLSLHQDSDSSKLFRSLDSNRQVAVFGTLDLWISNRPDTTEDAFGSVVSAFFLERNFLESCTNGLFSLDILQELRQSITRCGGVLINGLVAEGPESVGSFYDDIVMPLKIAMPGDVFLALISALNAKLRQVPLSSVNDFLSLAIDFLAPFAQNPISQVIGNSDTYLSSVDSENLLESPSQHLTISHPQEGSSDFTDIFPADLHISTVESLNPPPDPPELPGIENQSSPHPLSQQCEDEHQPVSLVIDAVPTTSSPELDQSNDDPSEEAFHQPPDEAPDTDANCSPSDASFSLDPTLSFEPSQFVNSPEDEHSVFKKKT